MERYKCLIGTIIFNIAETILIFLIGRILRLDINNILIVMLCFMISRGIFGKALHFKTWYRCLIWSLLILFSLFLILKIDLKISILFTIFSAFIMTGKSNIQDMYLWKRNELNDRVLEWVRFNLDNEDLLKYKEQLKVNNDKRKYYIYQYYFEEGKSQNLIAKIMDIDVQRINEEIRTISHHIEYGIRLR